MSFSELTLTTAEIKLAILNNITDIASLKALIHACPITHALYIQDRKRLLTQATLKGLRTKHSNVFKFAHTLDIRLNQMWNRESTQENLEAGLKLLQHHYLTHGEVRDDSVLSLEQCR